MFGLKSSTKAVQAPAAPLVTDSDLYISAAWGITPAAWLTLTDEKRRDYRDRVAYAGRADGFGRPNA